MAATKWGVMINPSSIARGVAGKVFLLVKGNSPATNDFSGRPGRGRLSKGCNPHHDLLEIIGQ